MNYFCIFALPILLFLSGDLIAKEKTVAVPYSTLTISSTMKENAYAVCRDYSHEFELIDYGKAIERVHLVVTVLEEKGKNYGNLIIYYDKSEKVTSIYGKSYNQLGIANDKLKSTDIQDVNYTTAGAIYDDYRAKIADISDDTYPYTVEYSYEIEHNGLLAYPEWHPIEGYRISVEKSSFKFIYPETLNVRFRERNLANSSKKEEKIENKRVFEWQADSLKAWKEEPLSPPLSTVTPAVIPAPTTFIYEGSTGTMNTWAEYGKWIASLNIGRDQLPINRQNEIRSLIAGVKDTVKIISTLYQYMQGRTHYVAIQLGLGGYQPFPAETVDRLGYGDCKALSNYMKTLLGLAGIPSVYTIAGTATNQGIIMHDFPTLNQNNHAILCVPLKNDTIWLECTSQKMPSGYLGSGTSGKNVLLILPDGGKIAKTPLLSSETNRQNRTAVVDVQPNGAIKAEVITKYAGYQYDNVAPILHESNKEQEKALYENLGITGAAIANFTYDVKKEKIPEAIEQIMLTTDKYATRNGTRLFLPLNMFNQRKSAPSKVDNRKMPISQSYGYSDKDSIVYQLPQGYTIETLPKGKTFTSKFGEYQSSVSSENGKVIYVREIKVYKGNFPQETYQELVDFYGNILNSDKARVVLKEQSL